ncbi:MAG: adenylate/guanylate cyclase domain-containing protein, partial [Chthoniobacterales bacterium]
MRVRTQLVLALSALAVLTAATILAINFFGARAILFRQIQSEVLSIAATGARSLDASTHERIRTPQDEGNADYQAVQNQLRAIRDANRRDDVHVRFVYTLRPGPDGKWAYIVDAEPPGDDHSSVGDPVEFSGEQPHLDQPYAEKDFSTDEFGTWLSANAPILDTAGKPVALLGVDIAANDVLGQLNRLFFEGLAATGAALVLAIALAFGIARWLTAPLDRIGAAIRDIGEGKLSTLLDPTVAERRDEFGALATAVNNMASALRERNALKGALARMVSQGVADEIMAGQSAPSIGGHARQITVLIVDIRNFTAMSAALVPDHLVEFLNEFFARMIEAIFGHRGTLDKFLGDGCLAIFGAPLDDPDHDRMAVCAAQAILKSTAELGVKLRERHGLELRIGIGLHTGTAIVGYVGSDERTEYTAIGDTVNIASRLETLNK